VPTRQKIKIDVILNTGIGSEVLFDSFCTSIRRKRAMARRETGYQGVALRYLLYRWGDKG